MDFVFNGDINEWIEESNKRILPSCNMICVPNSKQLFFESKVEEIHKRYQAARLFLWEVDINDWEHWYKALNVENKR